MESRTAFIATRHFFPCWIKVSLVMLSALGPWGSTLAASGTWSSTAATGAWQTAMNWVSQIVPGAASGTTTNTDTATFNSGSTTTSIVPDLNRNLENIIFDTLASAYTIGTTGGNALSLTSEGEVQIASTFAGSNITESIDAPITLGGNSTFANNNTNAGVMLEFGGAIAGISSVQSLTISGAGSTTISGAIGGGNGTIAVIKNGAGTALLDGNDSFTGGLTLNSGSLTLRGNNTFSGGVEIDGGTLKLGNVNALGSNQTNAVKFGSASTGTLNLNGNSLTISGLVSSFVVGTPVIQDSSSTAATLTVNNSAASTYAGVLQDGSGGGSLSLIKAGAGTLMLSGNNTFTGGIGINSGILQIGSASALNSSTPNAIAMGGGTLDLSGHDLTIGSLSGSGVVTNSSLGTSTLAVTHGGTFLGVIRDGGPSAKVALTVSGNTNLVS